MGKIVFFDIDGTIWDWDTNVPDSTISAIRQLRENGHKAFLCSGRSRGNIRSPKLFDIGFDGVIAACGNHVEMDGKILYEKILAPELVQKIVRLCEEHRMPVVLEGPVKHWLSDIPKISISISFLQMYCLTPIMKLLRPSQRMSLIL